MPYRRFNFAVIAISVGLLALLRPVTGHAHDNCAVVVEDKVPAFKDVFHKPGAEGSTPLHYTHYYGVRHAEPLSKWIKEDSTHSFYTDEERDIDAPAVAYVKQTLDPSTGFVDIVISALKKSGHMFNETRNLLSFVYGTYGRRGTVPQDWIAAMRSLDDQLAPENLNYVAFTDPVDGHPEAVIRIFDGSPTTELRENSGPAKLPIEIEYPNLVLPDRLESNNQLIELGRLGKTGEIEGDWRTMIHAVAIYLDQSHYIASLFPRHASEADYASSHRRLPEAKIYVECSKVASRLYSKYGFETVFTPLQVGVADTYIMRIGADQLVQRFLFIDDFLTERLYANHARAQNSLRRLHSPAIMTRFVGATRMIPSPHLKDAP